VNVKKSIKKMFALGASGALVATTLAGAMAYDLSDYPMPFVKDGVYNAQIVIGADAATADVIGAVDIAASLQAAAVTPAGTGTTTTTVTGENVQIEGSSNKLNFAEVFSDIKVTALNDDDLPTLLADDEIKDDDNKVNTYTQKLDVKDVSLDFDSLSRAEYYAKSDAKLTPVLYYDYDTAGVAYELVVDFDKLVDITKLTESQTIEIAGTKFTIDPDLDPADDELILYKSEEVVVVGVGEEVEVGGKTVKVIGANTDKETATIVVDGKTYSTTKGDTVGDLYINEVFMQTIPVAAAQVEFFVGSDKIVLPVNPAAWSQVEVDGDDLDGVRVYFDDDLTAGFKQMKFEVNPTKFTDRGARYLEVGESLVDPLFETFKLHFEGASVDMKSGEYLGFEVLGDDLELTFTNLAGNEYSFKVFQVDPADEDAVVIYEDLIDDATDLEDVGVDKIFFLKDSTTDTYKVYEVDSVSYGDDADKLKVKLLDLGTNKIKEYADGDRIGDADAYVTISTADDYELFNIVDITDVLVANDLYFVTEAGAYVTIDTAGPFTINVDEFGDVNTYDSGVSLVDFDLTITADGGDLEVTLTGTETDKEGNYGYLLSEYGTYAETEEKDNTYVNMWIPSVEHDYKFFVSEVSSKVTSSGAAGSSYTVNPMGLGVTILDSQATLGSKPMIVVGGPVVNTVAAALLGNPSPEVIRETFSQGKAMIKFYGDKNAVLVAGWEAMETQAACSVLADYKTYGLSGTEMTVLATNLDSISVQKVN
jgi:hypothetical protein